MGRSWRNYIRDRVGLRARLGQTLFFGIILALVFADIKNTVEGVQDRTGLLFFGYARLFLVCVVFLLLDFLFLKITYYYRPPHPPPLYLSMFTGIALCPWV